MRKIKKGDIIYANNGFYKHYGIYDGNDTVIDRTLNGVTRRSLSDFCNGYPLYVEDSHQGNYSRKQALKKARSRVGESGYDLLNKNCEHLARECYGDRSSRQVDNALEIFGAVVLAPFALGAAIAGALFDD